MISSRRPVFAFALLFALTLTAGCGLFDPLPTAPTASTPTTPSPAPTPTPAPTPPAAPPAADLLISITSLRLEGQLPLDGLVTLGTPAPAGGATVSLTSNNPGVVRVPAVVTVAEGSKSATFVIETSTVATAADYTLTARYGDFTNALTFTLRPRIEARFSVSSQRRGANVCQVIDGPALDCQLDASASIGTIRSYEWTFETGSSAWDQSSRDPRIGIEEFGCDLIERERPITDNNGEKYVRLTIHLDLLDPDREFGDDEEKIIRLYVGSTCGF